MEPSLDEIGLRFGASKSSLQRDLFRHYERFVSPLRNEEIDLLEIGVGDGASLLTWLEYFPRARVVGLDVRRVRVAGLPARGSIVHGAQDDVVLLVDLLREFRFRVVIDDGSRAGAAQLASFLTLFPALEPGGLYGCEGVWSRFPADTASAGRLLAGRPTGPAAPKPSGAVDVGDDGDDENEPNLTALLVALGATLSTGVLREPEGIDRARFAGAVRCAEAVIFLPRAVVVTARGRRP